MSRFKLLYFVIFIINLHKLNAQISDKRLCVDEECKVPISHAKTLLRYSSPDSRILSFAPNVDITVYSKSAGSREDLWGGEINGKRGYVPKHMVRETKILQKPTLLVETEFSNDTETQVPSQLEPDKVQEAYEVVDGTTIYLSPQDNIDPTSTDSPVQPTALPETNEISQHESVTQPNLSQDQVVGSEEQNHEVPETLTSTEEVKTDEPNLNPEEEHIEEDEDVSEDEGFEDNEEEEDDEESDELEEPATENIEEVEDVTLGEDPDVKTESEVEAASVVEDTIEADSEAENSEVKAQTITPEVAEAPPISEATTEKLPIEEKVFEVSTENNIDTNSNSETDVDSAGVNSVEREAETAIPAESVEPVQSTEDFSSYNEATIPPNIDVTTISPEFEVPLPLDDTFMEVTANPLEQASEPSGIVQENVPTMPPLFANLNSDPYVKSDESKETPQNENEPKIDYFKENVQNVNEMQIDDLKENLQNESFIKAEDSKENLQDENYLKIDDSTENIQNEGVGEETTNSTFEIDESNQHPVIEAAAIFESSSEESTDQVLENEISTERNEELQESNQEQIEESTGPGFFAGIMSFFGSGSEEEVVDNTVEKEQLKTYQVPNVEENHVVGDDLLTSNVGEPICDATSCPKSEEEPNSVEESMMDLINFNSDILLYLVTTAVSVIIFLFGYIAFDKSKREGPLVAKINKLEKELLIVVKENQILQEKISPDSGYENNDPISNEIVENLKQDLLQLAAIKTALEDKVELLEKELENSAEVGAELNRMISEILSSDNAGDALQANVEHLQRQLVEQQSIINSVDETLAITNTENHELRLELELSSKKVLDLQAEVDKQLSNMFKNEEEKETQQNILENSLANFRQKYEEISNKLRLKEEEYSTEIKLLKNRLDQTERKLELKTKEHAVLTDTLKQVKTIKNDSTLRNLLDVGNMKAELQLLKSENKKFVEKIQQEVELRSGYEKRSQAALDEVRVLTEKYDRSDKLKVESQTKLEVLSNYFKDREAQWQKEISKHEALWAEKEGEATSTTERIKFMQEQVQNYKAQTDSLKQEIMSQEIELKSQISVLEKKVHENWVNARQAERKLEESKQEGAQLRHRLTLRERAFQEDKSQRLLQSPIEQNGDMSLDSPASPPLLYGTRDHITKSPAIPGLPPFLPPPPGVPFMPPPIHGVPFIPPPPPNMFPGDHRPPPLGRMSSPPLNSRYSPNSRGYSPYDRNSSSPSDSEYGTSPPHRRGYSPFNNRSDERREYKRAPPGRTNGRNLMKGGGSSGSGHSNESLEKISRQQSKV